MKNILYAVIAVLTICIGILFYQIQDLKKLVQGDVKVTTTSANETKTPVVTANTDKLPDARIAYINIDTLNEKYLFISDYVKILKSRRLSLESQLQAMSQKFQENYESAQQSAQAGILPPAEMESKKRELEQQQREIENKQIQMDNLALEMQEKNDELQRNVKIFLADYNQGKYDYIMAYTNTVPTILLANPKLEITNQVLEALNTDYKNKKNNQKK
jgi:outer membrane protein